MKNFDVNNIFSIKPSDLKKRLDKVVVGQDHVTKLVSTILINHYKTIDAIERPEMYGLDEPPYLNKSNILLTGMTGSGKTFIFQSAAAILGVEYSVIDLSKVTASNYKGDSLGNGFENFMIKLRSKYKDYDQLSINLDRSIVILDELDKLAANSDTDESATSRVQEELLGIISSEDGLFLDPNSHKNANYIPTQHMFMAFTGAFDTLIRNNLKDKDKVHIGFGDNIPSDYEELNITTEKLISVGIIPELAGRITTTCQLRHLDKSDYMNILTNTKNSLLSQVETLSLIHDKPWVIEKIYSKEFLNEVVEEAYNLDLGARALKQCIDKRMADMFYY